VIAGGRADVPGGGDGGGDGSWEAVEAGPRGG
jgi:hypothetical protein